MSSTLQDVERWLEEKSAELREKEEALAEFRRNHSWELPSDLPANLQLLAAEKQRLDLLERKSQDMAAQIALLEAQRDLSAFVASHRLPESLESVQSVSDIVVVPGVVRLKPQGLFVVRNRLLGAPQTQQGVAQAAVGLGVVGNNLDQALQ